MARRTSSHAERGRPPVSGRPMKVTKVTFCAARLPVPDPGNPRIVRRTAKRRPTGPGPIAGRLRDPAAPHPGEAHGQRSRSRTVSAMPRSLADATPGFPTMNPPSSTAPWKTAHGSSATTVSSGVMPRRAKYSSR